MIRTSTSTAQRIISTPGKQDGLYWKNADGTRRRSDRRSGGQGDRRRLRCGNDIRRITAIFFSVLKGQGPAAPLGELDYVINGAMIGGFALIATPADYGVTGVRRSSSTTTASCIRRILDRTPSLSPGRSPVTTLTRRGPARTTRGRNQRSYAPEHGATPPIDSHQGACGRNGGDGHPRYRRPRDRSPRGRRARDWRNRPGPPGRWPADDPAHSPWRRRDRRTPRQPAARARPGCR